ncbi:MAG: ABC transporter permease [Acidimicrobiales bacterium]
MLPFIIRRLLIAIPLLLVSSFLVFVMVASAGRPQPYENALLNPRTSPERLRQIELQFDLDKPVVARYWNWVTGAVQLDFGEDNAGREVWPQIRHGLAITMRLISFSALIAVAVAIAVGVISALRQYSLFDYAATFSAFLFFSLPVFWLAVLLKLYGGIKLNQWFGTTFFYTIGHESPNLPDGFFARLADYAGHTILPAITLILISYAVYSRYTRSSMLDVMNADYVRTARAKGVPRSKVVVRHGLRNALIPVTTVVALDFGALFSGAIITETVFQWRGMGTIFIEGLRQFDVYKVSGWLLVTAVVVIVFNIIADIAYAILDPRIRL